MEEGLGMGDVGVGEVFLKRRICREGKTYLESVHFLAI